MPRDTNSSQQGGHDVQQPQHVRFTSDLHLDPANILRYCNRPFRDVGHRTSP
jgi:hypothetical protein